MIKKWANDEEYKSCNNCNTYFNFFIRKHHCRKCGYIYCNKCINTYLLNNQKILICDICYKNVNMIIEIEKVEYNKLKKDLEETKKKLLDYENKIYINKTTQTEDIKEIDTKEIQTEEVQIKEIETKEIQTEEIQIEEKEEEEKEVNVGKISNSLDILECIKDMHNKEQLNNIVDEGEYEIKKYELAKEKRQNKSTKELVLERKKEKKRLEEEKYKASLDNIHKDYEKEIQNVKKVKF